MGPGRSIVHVVGGHYFIFDTEMVESEDIVRGFALKGVKVFNGEVVEFIPFEFEAGSIILKTLELGLVKEVKNFLFVDLEVGAVDSEFSFLHTGFFFDEVEELMDGAGDYTFIFSTFNHWNGNALLI